MSETEHKSLASVLTANPAHRRLLSNLGGTSRKDARIVNEAKALESMKSLGKATQNKRAARRMAKNQETIRTLVNSMTNKQRFTKLVEYSVECLKNLAVDEFSVDELIDEGTLEAIDKVKKVNPYNERIALGCHNAISAYAINDYLSQKIMKKVGPEGFVFSLKKHVEADTLISSANAACKLMTNDEHVKQMVDSGLIEALAHAAKENPQNADVLAAMAKAGAKIAEDPANAERLMNSGLMTTILSAMKEHSNNESLQKAAAAMIGQLAKSNNPAIIAQLKEAGAIDMLAAALEMFPEDEELLKNGAAALRLLAGINDVGSALGLISTGNMTNVMLAMTKLAGFSLVEENIAFMVEQDGLKSIIQAITHCFGSKEDDALKIIEAGCRTLMRLATSEQNIYAIMKHKGVKAIIQILKEFVKEERIVAAALGCLSKMLTREENASYIFKCGGIDACLDCMKEHLYSSGVCKYSCALIDNMGKFESMIESLIEKDCIEAIVKLLQNNIEDSQSVTCGLVALGTLVANEKAINRLVSADGIAVLLEIMNSHPDDVDIIRQALHLLDACASVNDNLDKMREMHAMDALLKCLEEHATDEIIQEIGGRALGRLAGAQELKVSIGNVDDLVGRLSSNPGLAKVILKGLAPAVRMLSNLAMMNENIDFLIENGGVESLSQAFIVASKLDKSDLRDGILAAAVQGLARLCENQGTAEKIIQSGTWEQILLTAIKNLDNEDIVLQTMNLAVGLSSHPTCVALLKDTNTIESIINMVKEHPLNEDILKAAATALANFCQDSELSNLVCNAGGAMVVVEALYAHMDKPSDLIELLKSLANMAKSPESANYLMEAGSLDAICDILRAHPDDPNVVLECVKALLQLGSVSNDVRDAIGKHGAIPLVLKGLRDHYSVEELVESTIALLACLAQEKNNIKILLDDDLGTIELVEWAAGTFDENVHIREPAAKLIDLLRTALKQIQEDQQLQRINAVTEEQMIVMLNQLKSNDAGLMSVLADLAELALDPEQCALLVANNGIQSLAGAVLSNLDEEDIFKASAVALQNLINGADPSNILSYLNDPQVVEALVEMIKPHANWLNDLNSEEIVAALEALTLVAATPENVMLMLDKGALEPLVKLLTSSKDAAVLESVIKLLAKISNDEKAAELLAKLCDIRALIEAMRKHIDKPEFLTYAVYLLGNLAINDDMKKRIGIEGGIAIIIQIMERYREHQKLIDNSCYALGNLSYECEVNISLIVACHGIEEIIAAINNFPIAADLLDSCVCALCNLCYKNDSNKENIVKLGGAKAIVSIMLDNVNAVDLLLSCFRTIGNLAFFTKNIPIIIEEGGVQGIVAAMTVHNTEMEVINMSIRVLANLAVDVDEHHMKIMAEEGAVQAIVDVALEHPTNLDISIAAFGCLCNFAREPSNSRMIVRQGGLKAISLSVAQLNFDADLCGKSLRLMSALSYNSENTIALMEKSNIQTMLLCMKTHPKDHQTIASAMLTIANMSSTKDNAQQLSVLGITAAVLAVTNENSENITVLQETYHALAALCRSEQNAISMSTTVMTHLSEVFTRHAQNSNFCVNAFTFLSNMCVFPDASQACIKTSMIQAINHAISAQLSKSSVLQRACRALENMAISTNEVKQFLKDQRVIGVMENIQKTYTGRSEDIVNAAQRVIDAINTPIRSAGLVYKKVERKARDARDIFGDNKGDVEVTELAPEILNLLKSGALLIKHSKKAPPRPRHVYVTPDLKYLCWKNPNKKLQDSQMMKTFMIREVEKGRCTPQLQRKKRFGGYHAREETAFAVLGRERTVDLEGHSEQEREAWVNALTQLMNYLKAKKKAQSQF